MLNFLPRAALISELHTLLAPTAQDPLPPEFHLMVGAINSLPGSADSQYALIDLEVMQAPEWLAVLPTSPLAQWQGTEQPEMWGYGGIERLEFSEKYGTAGLNIWLAGSPASSATSIYVVPKAAAEYIQVTEY